MGCSHRKDAATPIMDLVNEAVAKVSGNTATEGMGAAYSPASRGRTAVAGQAVSSGRNGTHPLAWDRLLSVRLKSAIAHVISNFYI